MTMVGDWGPKALLKRFGKLRGRSLAELRERLGQAVTAQFEIRQLASTVGEPSDRAFWSRFDPYALGRESQSAESLRAHFASRTSPAFFAGVRDGTSAAELNSPRWAEERRDLLLAADRILAGKYDLLGYTGLSFGSPIDWHFDPIGNVRAPRQHWSRIPYLNADVVGDHKVIWEINRHQHFYVLGRAFQVTHRAEFAERFVLDLTSWMDANPPKEGVNWASTLEVAYRAISWVWAIELFRESPALTPAILQRALGYLYLHGRHVERYLSTYFSPNTHLTGEALGLLYLGTMLPEFRRASIWRTLGWSILERELPRQVLEDGVYFEQATYYHRYTVDIYLHALLLAKVNGVAIPPAMAARLSLAAGHLADLMRPDGTIPVIGDDDGGKLVQLEKQSFTNVRAALGTASAVLVKPELAAVAGGATEEVLWLLGPAGVRAVDEASAGSPPAHQSVLSPVGGYAIMRDGWGSAANHTVIDCGPLGAMNCGHAHSDALSIEITVAGCPMIVDPGTFTYTSSAVDRDAFRHSAAHNTVTVDGRSSSVSAGPFSWGFRADAKASGWWAGTLVDRFVGSHPGFERLPEPAVHRREVLFVRGQYWVIIDTVLSVGRHEAVAHFHTALGSSVAPESPSSAWIETPCASGRRRLFFAVLGDAVTLDWGSDWVSAAYGSRQQAPLGRVVGRGAGRRDIVSVLVPASEGQSVSVSEVPAKEGRALLVDRHD
ncbi:MAG: alginate lyase family protein, partial [bacterium]